MRNLLLLLLLTLLPASQATAQDKPKAFLQCDFVSHYMWRGQDKGNASIQPKLGLRWKGLRLSVEGSGGFSNDDYEELDIILTYRHKGFTVGLLDEWGEDWLESKYFEYGHETTHQFSFQVGYDFDFASIDIYTIFAGADHKPNGQRAYSTYMELNVPFRFATLDWNAGLGFTPYESGGVKTQPKGDLEEYFEYSYADQLGVCMLALRATKEFKVFGYPLPVFVEVQGSPYSKNANIIFGVTAIKL